MKIKPTIYAQILIDSAKPDNLKVLAKNLWQTLQKNKQYRDLPRILDLLDEEYARKNNMILAKVYSEKKLDEAQIEKIKINLSCHFDSRLGEVEKSSNSEQLSKDLSAPLRSARDDKKEIMIQNIIKKTDGGINVEVEGKIIDLTTSGKLNRLKGKLSTQ